MPMKLILKGLQQPNWEQLDEVYYVISVIRVSDGLQKFESVALFLSFMKIVFHSEKYPLLVMLIYKRLSQC